jgi:hypothetical protein
LVSCANSKEINYTGSTPASTIIRAFLEISLSDSIDFIRWKLTLNENNYILQCNYGIGKNNTNGFINGGKNISINGLFKKEKNIFLLINGDRSLKLVELNANLLHLLNANNTLLVGNGGWSYTLNNINPAVSNEINIKTKQPVLKDSMIFEGRTPCGIPGIISDGNECYKLKWKIILYADAGWNLPTTYKIIRVIRSSESTITGNWEIIKDKEGNITYRLHNSIQNTFLYLVVVDENILLFTDAYRNLLVGNEDFSYTLNKLK